MTQSATPSLEGLSPKKRQLLELMLAERKAKKAEAPPLPRADRSQPLPLSFAQKRLWFLNQLDTRSPAYNIPAAVYLVGPLDHGFLEKAWQVVLQRHEDLRTNFVNNTAGEAFATIKPELRLPLPFVDLSSLGEAAEDRVQRLVPEVTMVPFDITRDPLVRLVLVRLAPEAHVLVLVVHHIIADVWSIGVLFKEIGAAYDAFAADQEPRMPELPMQYADYVAWLHETLEQTGELDRQEEYWVRQLGGVSPVINLPTDFPRPPRQTVRGMRYAFHYGDDVHKRLQEIARPEEASLYMAALAVFYILLYRYTGQREILVGTPMANRDRVEFEVMIGFFVNTVVLRCNLDGDPTYRQLLRQIRATTLEAFAHHDLPFERVVNALKLERDLSRNPLYQVDFAFQNLPSVELTTPGLSLRPFTLAETTSRFDLEFDMKEADDGLDGFIRYNTALFARGTIQRMAHHYRRLLDAVLDNPDCPISQLPMLTDDELRYLVTDLNKTAAAAPQVDTAHGMIARWVERTPEEPAVIGADGESVSFADLSQRASVLAEHLLARGTREGDIVALALPREVEAVVAILAVWRAGAAWLPLDPSAPEARLRYQLEDAAVTRVISLSSVVDDLGFLGEDDRDVVLADALTEVGDAPPLPSATGENAAYVIYTSGSTGRPKGVKVHHRALVNYLEWCREAYGLDGDGDGSLVHSPLTFDLTVTGLIAPLAAGQRVRLVEEGEGIGPLATALCEESDLTLVKITPAHLEALSQIIKPADARRVRTLVIGGEALTWETVRFWHDNAPETRLINEYGPTETVVGCSVWEVPAEIGNADTASSVPIGHPIRATQIYVADTALGLTPVGVVGELLVGGAGVARGYLGRPGLTAERFIPDPWGEAGGRLYRTGDLVRRLPGDELIFIGRRDNQVKVRGYRIELGEIEAALTAHPDVQEAAVLVRTDLPGGKTLVAYVAAPKARNLSEAKLRESLAESLPEYMLPTACVFLPTLPLNTNGKVDRAALPAPGSQRSRDADYVAPRTPTETQVAGIWASILDVDRVSVNDRFFDLGGQSMLAVQVVSRIRDALQVEVPVQSLFNETTVRSLSEAIEEVRTSGTAADSPPITPVPRGGDHPLSFAQERLWFIDQLMPGLTAYNIPGAVRMRGRLDRDALQRALNEIIGRHEVLRTTFKSLRGRPVQVISDEMPLTIEEIQLEDLPEDERWDRAVELALEIIRTPFDLAAGPLMRASLIDLGPDDALYVMAIHHIVYDMWSRDVFLGELVTLYEAFSEGREVQLPNLEVQYADYAVWQREWLSGDVLAAQLDFWRERLAGLEPLELPADKSRGAILTQEGARVPLVLTPELTKALKKTSRRQKVTLFVTLLSGFYALLHRYTGAYDLAVGSPVANRNRSETEAQMGFFANTLVLRTKIGPQTTVKELLGQVREGSFEAFAHQDLAFEKLVEELQPERDLSRQPLFQVMFNFLINYQPPTMRLPELTLETVTVHTGGVPFDFTLSMYETDGRLHAMIDYSTDLFEEETVRRWSGHFENLLAGLAKKPTQKIADLPWIGEAERQQLLTDWEEPALETIGNSLHGLFEAQVDEDPEAAALIWGGETWTYRQLNDKASSLAGRLQSMGVGPDVRVGLASERCAEMVVAMLAILKAGGAYVPLDPAYPSQRLQQMLEDASVRVLVTQSALVDQLPEPRPSLVLLDEPSTFDGPAANTGEVLPNQLAYTIFTSGSTGRPKGVAIEHRSAVALIAWAQETFDLADLKMAASTSINFDLSVFEIFAPLASGGTVMLVRDALDIGSAEGAELLNTVPSAAAELLRRGALPESIRTVNLAGEPLKQDLVDQLHANDTVQQVMNLYGPSEDTTYSTFTSVVAGREPTIGIPLPGTQACILDPRGRLQGIGIPGELCLGGDGLARGYLGQPAQKAERFVPDPFWTGDAEEGRRLYRTGDLVKRLADGELAFLGRIDHQVKVRGFRIELGEIEAALLARPQITDAIVVARGEASSSERSLVAYVVAAEGTEAAGQELRRELQAVLPDYMVPSFFVMLDALPLTPNGKVDRRALPEPGRERPDQEVTYVAPRNPVEETVAGVWSEILGLERVGVEDNFFDLGGHSLLATRVVSQITESFDVELPLRQLFSQPTVAGLALTIERQQWALNGAAGEAAAEDEEEGEL